LAIKDVILGVEKLVPHLQIILPSVEKDKTPESMRVPSADNPEFPPY
jgi:hypothetical protein